ncbi:MAG: sensor histidine kinase [Bacteroidia bacterium]
MNNAQKSRWKIILVIVASVIVGSSLWYSNILVNKMELEERQKVKLWAEAIQRKAKLVKYANTLFNQIGGDERQKVQLWADATKMLASTEVSNIDLGFIFKLIQDNQTVPVILIDDKNKIISSRNLDSAKQNDTVYLRNSLKQMKEQHEPIEITVYKKQKNYLYYQDSKVFTELKGVLNDLQNSFMSEVVANAASVPAIITDSTQSVILAYGSIDSTRIHDSAYRKQLIYTMQKSNTPIIIDLGDGGKQYIFYEESLLSKELLYFPYLEFGIIGLFMLFSYSLFSTARRAEQNRVWIGMAKETAHQLGTPLSSLMAWVDYLKTKNFANAEEIEKDVKRLEIITSRFSKIGSSPQLEMQDVSTVLQETLDYMRARTSHKVKFVFNTDPNSDSIAPLNSPLFSWVIENLFRNAIDAMGGDGTLTVDITDQVQFLYIDISDTGKGIPKGKFKTIFEPGYTTKERGWGLGLSLCKRIIEDYHDGKIFVKNSELNKGTTFRIVLKKRP